MPDTKKPGRHRSTSTTGRHRASTAESPVDAVPTNAKCAASIDACGKRPCGHYCPRHNPAYYAEYMARHATDSIAPSDRDPWSGRR